MFIHMSIHYPQEGKKKLLIDSMHRFGKALESQEGFINANCLEDENTGRLIGLALWESKEAWDIARHMMHDAVKDDPFEEWETRQPEMFHLHEK